MGPGRGRRTDHDLWTLDRAARECPDSIEEQAYIGVQILQSHRPGDIARPQLDTKRRRERPAGPQNPLCMQ